MEAWGPWDWIGYACLGLAALVEAANASLSGAPKLSAALPWLTGGFLPYLPIVLFAVGSLVLLARALGWFPGRTQGATSSRPHESISQSAPDTAREVFEPAPQPLVDFVLDHVRPTYDAITAIEHTLIERQCENVIIKGLAFSGLQSTTETATFQRGIRTVAGLWASPPYPISKSEIIDCVLSFETGYAGLCEQLVRLAVANGSIVLARDTELTPLVAKWRKAHDAMVAAYEPIKRNRDFGKLWRPAQPSRWGDLPPITGVSRAAQ